MSDENQSRAGKTEESSPSPAATSEKKKKSVFIYLAILFAAAFLLLLFAYLMQQRNSAEILGNLSDLRESMTSFQSLDEVMEENRTLREQNEALQSQVGELGEQLENAQKAYEMMEGICNTETAQAGMLETLYFAEIKFAEEDYAGAAAELAGYDTAELEAEIARRDAQLAHYNPPHAILTERYEAMKEFLIEQGYLIWNDSGDDLVAVNPEEE